MSVNEAEKCSTEYLKAFRKCPDNGSGLDKHRGNLWRECLPDGYKHLYLEIYDLWLKYRYTFLAMPEELLNLLRRLRSNYLVALITNGPSEAQWEKIHMLNLTNLFDCILVSSDLQWEKPHPLIFQTACNYLNVAPNNCIMIGDQLNTDIIGSINAGLALNIYVPIPNSQDIDLNMGIQPDIIIKNVLELESMFLVDPPTGKKKPLKKSSSRSSVNGFVHTINGCFTSKPYQGCFSTPMDCDHENSNSNASDGS